MNDETEMRAVSVQLRNGERHRGLLALESPTQLALEIAGKLLVLAREEVVAYRFLEPETSLGDEAARAVRTREEVVFEDPLAALLARHEARASLLYVPARHESPAAQDLEPPPDGPGETGPFPLWEPEPNTPLQRVPHLLALEEGERCRALVCGFSGLEGVVVASRAPRLQLARYLGYLRWAHTERGRLLGLRFHDPRVLGDLCATLPIEQLGVLFGSVWVTTEGGEDLLCPLCDAEVPGLSRTCRACGARFSGDESAPRLIESFGTIQAGALRTCTPCPEARGTGRRVATRPIQRGRKSFRLEPEVVRALGAAYRARIDSGTLSG